MIQNLPPNTINSLLPTECVFLSLPIIRTAIVLSAHMYTARRMYCQVCSPRGQGSIKSAIAALPFQVVYAAPEQHVPRKLIDEVCDACITVHVHPWEPVLHRYCVFLLQQLKKLFAPPNTLKCHRVTLFMSHISLLHLERTASVQRGLKSGCTLTCRCADYCSKIHFYSLLCYVSHVHVHRMHTV